MLLLYESRISWCRNMNDLNFRVIITHMITYTQSDRYHCYYEYRREPCTIPVRTISCKPVLKRITNHVELYRKSMLHQNKIKYGRKKLVKK